MGLDAQRWLMGAMLAALAGCTGPGPDPTASIPPNVTTLPMLSPASDGEVDTPGIGIPPAQPPPEIGPDTFGDPHGPYSGSRSPYFGYN